MIIDMLRYPVQTLASNYGPAFSSVLNRDASGFEATPGEVRSYKTATRGIIIAKDFLNKQPLDLTKGYSFQFNPQTISDSKETNYEVRSYPGMAYNDYIWLGGGERLISFQLFFDNTPQSKTETFNPKVKANKIEESIYKGKNRAGITDFGQIANFFYTGNAYSNSRVDERGIMPEVELIRSFLYPAPLTGESTPKFIEGGIVNNQQFRPPQTVVLCLGPLYLEGLVKSADAEYTLFDKDLTPIRGTMNVTFAAFEFAEITRKITNTPSR
jgi:hypothetical protein